MRRFDVKQDGALAGLLVVGAAGAELAACEAALVGPLEGATLDCGADGELAAGPAELEPDEPHPAARMAAMAAIPPVSEFWMIRALSGIRAIPSL
jgi:hypothetical protein